MPQEFDIGLAGTRELIFQLFNGIHKLSVVQIVAHALLRRTPACRVESHSTPPLLLRIQHADRIQVQILHHPWRTRRRARAKAGSGLLLPVRKRL